MITKSILFISIFIIILNNLKADEATIASKMDEARKLYYQSVKDEDKLELAIKAFDEIRKSNPELAALSITYIGSLTMIKGKHAFWPHQKVEFVDKGLVIMNKGIKNASENIEALFIYGSSCYYLPFFLGKKDLAVEKLRSIIPLLKPEIISQYDKKILKNALEFILKNIELSDSEKSKITDFLNNFQ